MDTDRFDSRLIGGEDKPSSIDWCHLKIVPCNQRWPYRGDLESWYGSVKAAAISQISDLAGTRAADFVLGVTVRREVFCDLHWLIAFLPPWSDSVTLPFHHIYHLDMSSFAHLSIFFIKKKRHLVSFFIPLPQSHSLPALMWMWH